MCQAPCLSLWYKDSHSSALKELIDLLEEKDGMGQAVWSEVQASGVTGQVIWWVV